MTLAPPESTAVLTLTAVAFAFVSNLLILRFVDLKNERRMKAEVAEWNKALKAAVKSKDKKEEEKLRKRESSVRQMQLKATSSRTKVSLITIAPFFVIYYLMLSFVGPVAGAFSPFYIPYLMTTQLPTGGYQVTTFGWYLISSFAFSGVITRLLKTSP